MSFVFFFIMSGDAGDRTSVHIVVNLFRSTLFSILVSFMSSFTAILIKSSVIENLYMLIADNIAC